MSREMAEKDAENVGLQLENQQLRERLELVEAILKNNSQQLDQMVSTPVKKQVVESNTKFGKFSGYDKNNTGEFEETQTVDNVYTELI